MVWKGSIRRPGPITPPEAEKHLMVFSVRIPPKTAYKGVSYRHEGEEFVYVASGEVEITTYRYLPGDG